MTIDKKYSHTLKSRCSYECHYTEFENKIRKTSNVNLEGHVLEGSNYIANRFSCTEKSYKDIIDRCFFVGITENEEDILSNSVVKQFAWINKLGCKIYKYCSNRVESPID